MSREHVRELNEGKSNNHVNVEDKSTTVDGPSAKHRKVEVEIRDLRTGLASLKFKVEYVLNSYGNGPKSVQKSLANNIQMYLLAKLQAQMDKKLSACGRRL